MLNIQHYTVSKAEFDADDDLLRMTSDEQAEAIAKRSDSTPWVIWDSVSNDIYLEFATREDADSDLLEMLMDEGPTAERFYVRLKSAVLNKLP